MIFQNWWSTQTGSLSVKKETLELLKTYIFLREALKKNSKKSDQGDQNHILFEEKNSDMEGRYKN